MPMPKSTRGASSRKRRKIDFQDSPKGGEDDN
jgi:hypothetical protein